MASLWGGVKSFPLIIEGIKWKCVSYEIKQEEETELSNNKSYKLFT